MIDLKPCPFCGGKAVVISEPYTHNRFLVACKNRGDVCKCEPCTNWFDTPEAPIRDYRPENAPFVTANGKPVGLLKSIRPDITEIVISTSYCGCEFVNGELASVEILKEPLDKWEERYGKAIDDSKTQ